MQPIPWNPLLKACLRDYNASLLASCFHKMLPCKTYNSESGSTPIHFAVVGGGVKTIDYLIQIGFDINAQNQYGETALHWACKEGDLLLVQFLLHNAAVIEIKDAEGNSPLHWAAEYNLLNILEELLYFSPTSLHQVNFDGQDLLQVALFNESLECAEYLEEKATRKVMN